MGDQTRCFAGLCILHIANDYSGSVVYRNLAASIDKKEVQQTYFTAVRSQSLLDKNNILFKHPKSKIVYKHILDWRTKVCYNYKIHKVAKSVESVVNSQSIDVIHAHTWFSDGGSAYLIGKKYNIPYVVTVRSSDTEVFLKYMIHLRPFARKVLINAKKIIFIGPTYMKRVLSHDYFKDIKGLLESKSEVIPNGIDHYWLKNFNERSAINSTQIKLIYIGSFLKRKNVPTVLRAVDRIRNEGLNIRLTLIGGGGSDHDKVMKYIQSKPYFRYLGKVNDKEKLRHQLNASNIFVMPSIRETFGLVYLEAISQGLPIIYTADDAIDGLFPRTVGEAVGGKDKITNLVQAIKMIHNNRDNYTFRPQDILEEYSWDLLATRLLGVYRSI